MRNVLIMRFINNSNMKIFSEKSHEDFKIICGKTIDWKFTKWRLMELFIKIDASKNPLKNRIFNYVITLFFTDAGLKIFSQ